MTTTSIDRACPAPDAGTESELRAAARRRGLTMKELAVKMGVSAGYLSQIANGGRPWTPKMREKVAAVLGEVPGQGIVYRQGGVVTGESSFIRERARTLGMTMQDLADRVGVSYSYMTQVARGRQSMGVKVQARVESALHGPAKVAPAKCANRQGVVVAGESSYIRERARELGLSLRDLADRVGVSYSYMSMVARGHSNMGVKVQARMESALEAPAKVAPAQPACIDREAMWERMNAHGISQNEAARRAGISSSNLSQIMNGRNNPSPVVLKKLHGVLFQPTKAERVMPAEVKVVGWRKGERSGMVVRGAKSGGGTVRVGGRVPWGAKAEFAYRAGVRRHGPGLGDARRRAGLLRHAEAAGDGSCVGLHDVPHDGRLPRSSLGRPAPGRIRESRRGRAFARSSIRLGALPEPDRPRWGGAVRLPSLSACRRRLGETCVRVPASSSNYHEKEDDSNEPRRFHRHVQGRHCQEGGGVLPVAPAGRGDGRALPGPLLPRLHVAGRGQGRRAPDGRRPEPQEAHLRRLRLSPLAGRQVRPRPLPSGRLREAPDEGLLRPAGRG